MRVRILKASKNTYWYTDKIGEEFEVSLDTSKSGYINKVILDCGSHTRFIDREDCKIVSVTTALPAFPADKWKMRVSNTKEVQYVNAVMTKVLGERQLGHNARYDTIGYMYFGCGDPNGITTTQRTADDDNYFINKDAPEITFEQFCEHYGPPKEAVNAKMLLADVNGIAEAPKRVVKEQLRNAEPRTAPLSLAEANEVVRSGVDAMYWWK